MGDAVTMILKDKNVLLFMPVFFDYSDLLIAELKRQGAKVFFVENKIQKFDFSSPSAKLRLIRKVYHKFTDVKWKYVNQFVDWSIRYDIFIAVNGFSYDRRMIDKLRKTNPAIYTILYLWDSTKMFNWSGIETDFDNSFTFDPLDARKLKINYLANFYPQGMKLCINQPTIDLFFVGTQHADRFKVIWKIYNSINGKQTFFIKLLIRYRNILHNKYLYVFLKTLRIRSAANYIQNYELIERKVDLDYLAYNTIEASIIEEQMANARCILDIQSPHQVGLPHQMMKALAMGKKIVTTNTWIANYDFYNEKQFLIIDRNNPIISKTFLDEDYQTEEIHDSISMCRIDLWLSTLLA